MSSLRASDLKYKAELLRLVPSEQNEFSEKSEDQWVTIKELYVSCDIISGTERMNGALPVGELRWMVRAWFDPSLTRLDRLLLEDGRTLEIESAADPDGRRAETSMTCRELVV